jgi:hypothetical protein
MKARSCPVVLSLVCGAALAAPAWAAEAAPMTHVFLDPDEPVVAGIRKLGERTIDQAGVSLVNEVRRVLAVTPTVQAIEALHLRSYKLPAATPGDLAVTKLALTSLRVRNPAHAPDAADRAALSVIGDQLERGDPVAKVLVQRVTPSDRPPEWRVYRPLSVMKQCLDCHGTSATLAPGVAARLQELYPADAAVDYKAGSWRGIVRVSIADPVAGK